ncbi:YtxH domain-containing protein [Litchfieldia alkalitelluris]|uniref:YtxH domain-containing protein n=1 Tax=Litchfieldia alkalitelluris TaxID=304268 RepID=UPI00099692AA|nr:YtxH domain-containing protein [Litchfieldia alkalitelluris]
MARNKMVEGMLLGAVVGAAISLFDRETREQVVNGTIKAGEKAAHLIKHPGQVASEMKENIHQVRTTLEQVSEDIRFITGKVSELNRTTPEMINMIKDTQDVFTSFKSVDENRRLEE